VSWPFVELESRVHTTASGAFDPSSQIALNPAQGKHSARLLECMHERRNKNGDDTFVRSSTATLSAVIEQAPE
jgi:hypothetical protein